jgi:hypothetical protein
MSVEFRDYYAILGVDRSADDKTIKSAYRRLARKYHPDVAKGKDAAATSSRRSRRPTRSSPIPRSVAATTRWAPTGSATRSPVPPASPAAPEWNTATPATSPSSSARSSAIWAGAGRRRMVVGPSTSRICSGGRPRASRLAGRTSRPTSRSRWRTAYNGARKTFGFEVEEPCATCHGAGHVGGKPCATCHGGGWEQRRQDVDVKNPAGVRTGQRSGGRRGPAAAPEHAEISI